MRRGVKILIVVVVAAATNFGLHAAFWGNCGNGQCGPNNYNHHGYWNQGGCNNQPNNCANPWGCNWNNSTTPTDTTKH